MRTFTQSALMRGGLVLLASSALLVGSSAADAASFNCRQAALPAEKAICGNANLSQLDARTAGMYFTIIGSDAPAPTLAQVKASQREFLQTRNACGADVTCLVDAYTSQMMFLKNVRSNLGVR